MQSIGILSVILFLASLTSFMVAFYSDTSQSTTGLVIGFLCLIVAAFLLGVTIKKRNRTERI